MATLNLDPQKAIFKRYTAGEDAVNPLTDAQWAFLAIQVFEWEEGLKETVLATVRPLSDRTKGKTKRDHMELVLELGKPSH